MKNKDFMTTLFIDPGRPGQLPAWREYQIFLTAGFPRNEQQQGGAYINIANASVWQSSNGGAVNLSCGAGSHGEYSWIDGLYAVNTDWLPPRSIGITISSLAVYS